MCTISWILSLDLTGEKRIKYSEYEYLTKIARKGEARGKDGIGAYIEGKGLSKFKPYHTQKEKKWANPTDPNYHLEREEELKEENQYFTTATIGDIIGRYNLPTAIFVHNRAIPESEVQTDNTQPIGSERYIVLHNGIISNDKEILWTKEAPIDTYAVLHLLETSTKADFKDKVFEALEKIQGSYALAIYDSIWKETILVTNFQSIAYKFTPEHLIFSTLAEYLELWDFKKDSSISYMKPYSYIHLNQKSGTLESGSIRKEKTEKKALVMASGWLDTCVVAWILKADYDCKDLTFLHFDYWHKVEEKEHKALEKIVEYYGAEYKVVKLDYLKELFKDTPLISGDIDETGKGMELSLEYVPTRNSTFSLLVASYAEVMDFDYIGFWWNLSESMAYSDTTAIWKRKANEFLEVAIGGGKKVEIVAPLEDLLKHEIVAEGIRVWAPMNLSWSCYQDNGTGLHCGKCASCRLRKIGMERNSLDIEGNKL